METLKKLPIIALLGPAVPLLSIYEKDMRYHRIKRHMALFVAGQLAIAELWRCSGCSSTEEKMKKTQCTHTVANYPAPKNRIVLFAESWMDHEIIVLRKINQNKS